MTAEPLPGMPRRLPKVTPSAVATWLDCPRRYRLQYVDRPSPPRGPGFAHHSVGSAVHQALVSYLGDLEPEDRRPSQAGDLVREAWQTIGFRDQAQSDTWRERAAGWVVRYAEGLPAGLRPRALERVVSFADDQARYEGRVDRVDQRGEEAVVVDYKTGRVPSTDSDARSSAALALYAVGVTRVLRLPCTRVELHHLPSGTLAAATHDEQSLRRHVARLADAALEAEAARDSLAADAGAADELFPTRPGSMCGWCDYRAHCADGRRATDAALPWAGLARDDED